MAQIPTNRHSLGTTGIEISPVILGCGTFGGIGGTKALIGRGLNREAAVATLNESLALGINVLDVSPVRWQFTVHGGELAASHLRVGVVTLTICDRLFAICYSARATEHRCG